MIAACPYCRDGADRGRTAFAALLDAIASDDLDAAIELGLLQFELQPAAPCANCSPAVARVIAARDARRSALAARERYRRRDARLARRAEAAAAKRAAGAPAAGVSKATLPEAAAAALARAKAKAMHRP